MYSILRDLLLLFYCIRYNNDLFFILIKAEHVDEVEIWNIHLYFM